MRVDFLVAHHNVHPKPFIWTKSGRDILQKVVRARKTLEKWFKQREALHWRISMR